MLFFATGMLAVSAAISAQNPPGQDSAPFVIGEDPEGRVIDRQGQPIAGARIEVICVGSPKGYLQALHEALVRTPLLPAISGRDGSYVLPLTEVHRLVYGAGPGVFVLQVSRSGYQTWRESLSAGLYTYLGSAVVLTALDTLPRLMVKIDEPRPGMVFAVKNSAMGIGSRYFLLGEDGELDLRLALVPNPENSVSADPVRPWFRRGRLLYPGRSSQAGAISPAAENLHWQAVAAPIQEPLRLLDPDAKAFTTVWGIYEASDGRRLRFEFAGSELPQDDALSLRYVGAEGMLSQEAGEARVLDLQFAPVHRQPLRLQVRDREGSPVSRCTGILWRLEDGARSAWPRIARPLAEVAGTVGGYLSIPSKALQGPALLELRAPGHVPAMILEPRRLPAEAELILERVSGGRLSFAVSSETGERIAGAVLFLSDRTYAAGGLPFGLLRSDEHGRIDLGSLQPGDYRYHLVATDRLPVVGRVKVAPGADSEVAIELIRSASMRLRTFDQQGRPLPFAGAGMSQISKFGRESLGSYRSDSRARIWLRGLRQDSIVSVDQRVLVGGSPAQLMSLIGDQEQACQLYPTRQVLLQLPDGLAITRLMTSYHSGSAIRRYGDGQAFDSASALLIAWTGVVESELILGLDAGPPVRILGSEVVQFADAGVLFIDRRRIVRRQRLKLLGVEGADLQQLKIQPISILGGRSAVSNRSGQMVEIDGLGDPWFVARDLGPYRCQVLHPEYLLRETTISSREASVGPIVIRLVKGTPLSFKGEVSEEMLAGLAFNLTIQGEGRASRIEIQNAWTPQEGIKVGDQVLIPCPVALLPGEYDIDLQLGSIRLKRSVLVLPGVPRVFDLAKD